MLEGPRSSRKVALARSRLEWALRPNPGQLRNPDPGRHFLPARQPGPSERSAARKVRAPLAACQLGPVFRVPSQHHDLTVACYLPWSWHLSVDLAFVYSGSPLFGL